MESLYLPILFLSWVSWLSWRKRSVGGPLSSVGTLGAESGVEDRQIGRLFHPDVQFPRTQHTGLGELEELWGKTSK